MARLSIKQESVAVTSAVLAKLAEDQPVRQELPGGGRVRFDRRLPFICVYRRRGGEAGDSDAGTEELLETASTSLILPASPRGARIGRDLLQAIVETLASHFGSFLVVELWSAEPKPVKAKAETNGEARGGPRFEIVSTKHRAPRRTIEALAKSLSKLRLVRGKAQVGVSERERPAPPGMKSLLTSVELVESNSHLVGLAIEPIYRHPKSGEAFPSVVRSMRRGLGASMKHAFFAFTHRRAKVRPGHYATLGIKSIGRGVFTIDHQLAAIGRTFDLLLQATPVNAEAAWHEFRRSRFNSPPVFYYRPLTLDPLLLKRQLFTIPVEQVDDPTLAYLFRQKQDELDRQITLLTDVDSPRFLQESLQIYGGVSDWLLSQATELLDKVPAGSGDSVRGQLTPAEFAVEAENEFKFYRKQCPDFVATASVREDLFSGLMVSANELLIGGRLRVPRRRVNALLQHEVGTHLVTRFNGRQQPIKQLEVGLAGYDGLQEGLAVLAEYLVGGLSGLRMRILAARVVAARRMVEGASFIETFRMLDRDYQFSQRTAYTIAMRTYRGGGLTKDAVYLRGLLQILKYLREGGELEPLYLGKIASAHLPLVAELRMRNIIKPPALRPRYLDDPAAVEKMAGLRKGVAVIELLDS
jgi:uncharacterized protein (TIGR02421 family)